MGSKPIKSFSKAIFEKFIVNHNPSIPLFLSHFPLAPHTHFPYNKIV